MTIKERKEILRAIADMGQMIHARFDQIEKQFDELIYKFDRMIQQLEEFLGRNRSTT